MQKMLRSTARKMIPLFLYGCCLGNMAAQAQTIKLRYEPQPPIVHLLVDDVTFLTDTSALFALYPLQGRTVDRDYHARIQNLIRRQLAESASDTAFCKGTFVPFNDGLEGRYSSNAWYTDWAILELFKLNKVKIMDQHGDLVERVRSKVVGSKKRNFKKRSYRNKATGEELFSEVLYFRTITPAF